jgi:hypothetical protein
MNNKQLPFDFAAMAARAKLILTAPTECWDTISSEAPDFKQLLLTYALPFIVAGALCSFVSSALIGVPTPLGTFTTPFFQSLVFLIIQCIFSPLAIMVGTWITAFISPKFGGSGDFNKAGALMIYSMTPGFVGGLLVILPIVGTLAGLLGLYGLFIFYKGTTKMLTNPADKQVVFTIINFIAIAITMMLLGMVLVFFRPLPSFM